MQKYIQTLHKLWNIIRPFHRYFYIQLVLIAFVQILIVGIAFINGAVLTYIVDANWHVVGLLFIGLLLSFQLDIYVEYLRNKNWIDHLDQPLFQFLQEFSMNKVLSLTVADHIEDHSALKLSIVAKGENSIQGIINSIITSVLPTVMLIFLSTVSLAVIHPLLGLLSFFVFTTIFFWAYWFQKDHYQYVTKNRDNWHTQQKERTEAFNHLGLVKLLARENYFVEKYMKKRQKVVDHHIFTSTRSSKSNLKRNLFIELSTVITLASSVYLYATGAFVVGMIYTVFNLVNRIYWNVSALSGDMKAIPQMYADAERYLHTIEKTPSFLEGGDTVTPLSGDVVFKDVSFKYPHSEKELFQKISFTVAQGKTTAFIGESGSGKTTISKLLLRSYDYGGSIQIGTTELREFNVTHLREHIGYVEQHVDLLDDTVKENILFGVQKEKRVTAEGRLEEVASLSRIDQFYHRLGEKRFNTVVGERGVKLSGGERQRVGIARAIIKDPEILIFDEATSSLDSENEKYVMEAIQNVSQGKTTIIIAHRLSTVRNADSIIVMDKGAVVAQGTHEELMRNSLIYQNLVTHQIVTS